MSLIAGSHLYRASLCAHGDSGQLDRDDADAVLEFADRIAPWNAPHRVHHMEVHAGQFFLTWGGLWHAVVPNRSQACRIACVARYARPDFRCCPFGYRDDRIELGERLPCLLVRGEDKFGLNDIRPAPTQDIFE